MKFTKDMVGDTIYAIPTGNNARRGQEIVEFTLVKVKRKYVDLKMEAHHRVDSYCQETGATQREINYGYVNNSGYRFFPNRGAIEDYKTYQKNLEEVCRVFGGYGTPNLSSEAVLRIHTILKEEGRVRPEEYL